MLLACRLQDNPSSLLVAILDHLQALLVVILAPQADLGPLQEALVVPLEEVAASVVEVVEEEGECHYSPLFLVNE